MSVFAVQHVACHITTPTPRTANYLPKTQRLEPAAIGALGSDSFVRCPLRL